VGTGWAYSDFQEVESTDKHSASTFVLFVETIMLSIYHSMDKVRRLLKSQRFHVLFFACQQKTGAGCLAKHRFPAEKFRYSAVHSFTKVLFSDSLCDARALRRSAVYIETHSYTLNSHIKEAYGPEVYNPLC
jgi:hypothetical protein